MPSNCPKHSLGANDKHPLVVSIVTEPVIKRVFFIKKKFSQMVLRAQARLQGAGREPGEGVRLHRAHTVVGQVAMAYGARVDIEVRI